MTNEEFLENLTKGLNDFLVEIVHENDKRADKIEKMINGTKRELGTLMDEVNLIRSVINEKWELDAIRQKQKIARQIVREINELYDMSKERFHLMSGQSYEEWHQPNGIKRTAQEDVEDHARGEFVFRLDYIQKLLIELLEIKNLDDFMI